MKFHKRPPAIEALPFDGTIKSAQALATSSLVSENYWNVSESNFDVALTVKTKQGEMTLMAGQYLVRDPDGLLSVMNGRDFNAQFYAVEA